MRWFKDWLKCFVHEPKVVCYWDANDREIGHSDPMSIARNYDVGETVEIEKVAVVGTMKFRVKAGDQ